MKIAEYPGFTALFCLQLFKRGILTKKSVCVGAARGSDFPVL